MICRHIRLVTFTLACLFLSGELRGAVIERDLHSAGDGRVTYDTVSGREWLDVTDTYEISDTELNELLQAEGPLEEFVRASRDDVVSFLASAGFVAPQMPGDQDFDLAVGFIDLVGGFHAEGGLTDGFQYTSGRYATAEGIAGDESIYVHAFGTKPVPGTVSTPVYKTYGAGIDNSFFTSLPPMGYWLYRPAPVPEPSAGTLAVGAMLAMGFGSRRQRRRAVAARPAPGRTGSESRVHQAILLIAVLGAMVTPRLSAGAVIERDLHAVGDGLLTYDTVSGREWLDLTATPSVSYAQIQASHGNGGYESLFDGFHVAQFADVFALLESAGISPDAMGQLPARPFNSSEIEAVSRLAELVCGASCHFSEGIQAEGGVGMPSLYQGSRVTVTAWNTRPTPTGVPAARAYGESYVRSIEGPDWFLEYTRNSPVGTLWLFRTAVPEPAVAALLWPLLFAWLSLRRRGLARP